MIGCIKKESQIVDHSQYPSPPTEPTPTAIPPNREVDCTYTIQKGDTLSQIAERFYGTTKRCDTITPLKKYNNIKRLKQLVPGKKIRLPIIPCRKGNPLRPKCEKPFSIPKSKPNKKNYTNNCKSVIQDDDILIYTFRKGDTIQKIAYRFYKKRSDCDTVAKLKKYNDIKRPDKMMSGDKIKLPVIYCQNIDKSLIPKCMTTVSPPAPHPPKPTALPQAYRKAINLYSEADYESAEKGFLSLKRRNDGAELQKVALAYLALIESARGKSYERDQYLREIIKLGPNTELDDLAQIAPDLEYRLDSNIRNQYQNLKRQSDRNRSLPLRSN